MVIEHSFMNKSYTTKIYIYIYIYNVYIYATCPPGYYQSANGPMVTHALGHRTSCTQVHELPWGHYQIGNTRDGWHIACLFDYIINAFPK